MSHGKYRRSYKRHRSDQRSIGPLLLPVSPGLTPRGFWRRFTMADRVPREPAPEPAARCDSCSTPISSGRFCGKCIREIGFGGYHD